MIRLLDTGPERAGPLMFPRRRTATRHAAASSTALRPAGAVRLFARARSVLPPAPGRLDTETIMTPELIRLRRALDCMPEADRRVFELARFEDLDYPAIAARLDLSVRQVEEHLARAIFHLLDYDQAR